ncbi:hypothetical protein QP179_19875 [Sphingomonas aurantiaca]
MDAVPHAVPPTGDRRADDAGAARDRQRAPFRRARSDDTALETHAWLDVGGLNVTRYPIDPALIEVGRFV